MSDLITDGDVYRIEQSWEMGYDTAQHTMPLIRALRAARADIARHERIVEELHAGYNARTNSLASKVADAEAEVIALRAEIGTIDGLLDYFGGLAELAAEVKAVEIPPPPIPVVQMKNTGHGHVWPRPDGARARCGGPGLCATCAREVTGVRKP